MKRITLLAISGVLIASGFSQNAAESKSLTKTEKAQISKEVDSALRLWEKAFNAKDPIALSNLYDLNTDVIYDDDVHHRSRQSMLKQFQENFRKEPNVQQKITEVLRTILSAHVVIETGVWENTGASDLSHPPRGRYSCTWMKKAEEWLIVHDRGWAMAKENDRSELRTRDQLSKHAHEFFKAFAHNDVKFLNEFFAEDVQVTINGTTVAISRKDYLARVDHFVNTLFKNIRFEKIHVHTNYFSPNSLASDGQTFGDLRPNTIWTNAWVDFGRIGRTTQREQVNGVHLDFRWENGKVVEMLVYGEATFMQEEEAALKSSRGAYATTRKDFNAFCAAHLGLWAGEVASVIGESVVGEKGVSETYYWEGQLANDGKLLTHKSIGPRGSSTLMTYYDIASKKICTTGVSSSGLVNQHEIHREVQSDGRVKWIRHTHQTAPDGTIRKFMSTITWPDNSNTITVVINRMKAESIVSTQTNVWHRVEK
jgi:ketosteroid isomerase-like protein